MNGRSHQRLHYEGIKSLKKKWGQLHLSEKEQISIIVGDEVPKEDSIKEWKSLVGMLGIERSVSNEAIQTTMGKI